MNSSIIGLLDNFWRSAVSIIDIAGIMRAADLAFQEEMESVGGAFREAIEDEYYDWPNDTIRHDGSVVGSPRNIVDRSGLQESQDQTPVARGEEEFIWTAPHSAINHNGGRKADGGVFQARPWTQHAIKGDETAPLEYQQTDALLDVPADFAAKFQALLEDSNA
jgi:hypothetical protein